MFYYCYHHYFCCHNRKQKLYNCAMEKKQKIAMKKLLFGTVIALGSNRPAVIIWGQYNSRWWQLSGSHCPRWELSGVAIVLGDNCPGGSCLGGHCPVTFLCIEHYWEHSCQDWWCDLGVKSYIFSKPVTLNGRYHIFQ